MTNFGLALLFARIALLTFGGGYAMVSLFQDEIVIRHQFLSAADFANLVAIAQITPGPIGFNSATYVGMAQGGWGASVAASLGVMIPSIIVSLVVAVFLLGAKDRWWVDALMKGVRPCVLGIIASAVVFFAETSVLTAPFAGLFHGENVGICWQGAVIFAVVLFVRRKWPKVSPVLSVILAAVLGWVLFL